MKILLLGEYSSLHWTLAEGLKNLGHNVTVASDGDGFKNYQRDIDLQRKSSSLKDTFATISSVVKNLNNFKGYDVVQIINPCFTQLSVGINKYLYRFLKKNNQKIFLGAFGDDSVWLQACLDNKVFKYSEFFINNKENKLVYNERIKSLWSNTDRDFLNKEIADSCDGIIACLYEYYAAYKPQYEQKLCYIPLPINVDRIDEKPFVISDKIKFFIGINKVRSEFKGTDKLYAGLMNLYNKYPKEVEILKAESVEYDEYFKMMLSANVVLDQIYSYSPAMNGLLTMAMGKVLVSGAEPEMYDLLKESNNRPIINVFPSEEDIINKLEMILASKAKIPEIAHNSRLFVEKHHNHVKVAQQYVYFWTKA